MVASWTFSVARSDLADAVAKPAPVPEPGPGEAVLRVDRVGLSANNVTYAVLGDAMRYWQFFPGPPDRGVVPLWGFAEVAASTVAGVEPGARLWGYLPSAGHLLVRPERVGGGGFIDASPHRTELPSQYNGYLLVDGDPAYRRELEDLLILFRPLFFTAFMLADRVIDQGCFGAETVVISSASSKTAYSTAFCLRGAGPRLVGLTSPGNVGFTRSLGCYDEVLGYDEVTALPSVATVYLDVSGAAAVRDGLRAHLGDRLVRDVSVGLTAQTPALDAADEFFFAPVQMTKRRKDWGRDGLDSRFAEAWGRFAEVAPAWVDVRVGDGPEALLTAWTATLAGRPSPRTGQILRF